jgi:hypothetical protein
MGGHWEEGRDVPQHGSVDVPTVHLESGIWTCG